MMLAVISFLTPVADASGIRSLRDCRVNARAFSIYLHTICFDYKSVGGRRTMTFWLLRIGTGDFPRTSNCKLERLQLSHLEFRPYAEMERGNSLAHFVSLFEHWWERKVELIIWYFLITLLMRLDLADCISPAHLESIITLHRCLNN